MPTNNQGPGTASAVRHEVEGPKMTDALYEGFTNEATPIGIDPADGLPRPVASQAWQDAQAPELDPARFVCMGDFSKFVIRGAWGAVLAEFEPSEVECAPDGRWRVKVETLLPKVQEHVAAIRQTGRRRLERKVGVAMSEENAKARTDLEMCASAYDAVGGYVEVLPIRPQCRHYARQLVPFPEERTRKLALRLCTARRTDEGEFLDVGNAQVFACELRSPVYGNEAAQLDAFDERTIADQRAAKAKEVADDFDLDAALGAQGSTTTKGN
jgi:hypothetical protein